LFDGELIGPDLSDDARARVRRVCSEAGLEICCIDTSFEVANPDASIEEGYGCLELGATLGSPRIRVFGGAPEGEDIGISTGRAAERIARLAERGRELGVRVALETHDSFASGSSTASVLATVPDRYAGALWDTLNPFVVGEPPEQTLDAVWERLVHVHIKDGGVPPKTEECRLAGEGRVPMRSILAALDDRGYDGWLSVEWEKLWQPQIAEPEVALPHYANALSGWLAELAAPPSRS
jgi:sugar phosphate isomerase/epimerase